MRIINPAFGPRHEPAAVGVADTTAPVDWRNDAIAIISNAKPNARELLEGLKGAMCAYRSTDNIDYHYKDSAAQPAPEALLDRVASQYKVAILALAD